MPSLPTGASVARLGIPVVRKTETVSFRPAVERLWGEGFEMRQSTKLSRFWLLMIV